MKSKTSKAKPKTIRKKKPVKEYSIVISCNGWSRTIWFRPEGARA